MLTAARSNGVDTNYSYDDAGRLTGVGHTGPNGGIDGFSYMLDPNGNRTAVMSNAGTETYTLDALNRLTNVTYPGALTETFEYDAAGNRTSHTKTDGTTVGYSVDATGQLISDTSGTTYTYDAAGNLTGTSDGESYTYDDYGRHISISAGGVTQTYGYDAQDVRVTVDGQTQLWDRNGGLPTLISTSGGDNYVHTAGIARDGDGWLLADAVGSVRTVVDNTGATTGTQSFTAFGEQLTGSGTFGFAGEQQDPTGLQHLRARQYNPALGRFTTVDPVQPGAPGTTGYNLYAYSGNNPTTWTDPSGQTVVEYAALAKRGALIGASISAALTPWTCDNADNAWYEPSTDIDASCVLTEIALGAIFGAIFGAISVDVKNGKTRATVRFTKRITRGERTALRAMVSDPSRIEFDYTAEHSLTSLSDMSEELLETMMVGSIPVSTLHIDISRNTVVAGVDPANSAQIARSISEVATDKRIAELVTVEERDSYEPTACFSRFSCGEPLRGGLFAENLDRPSLDAVFDPKGFASCTTGFMINRGGRRAITTAEHCGVPGDRFRLGGRVGPSNGFPFMSYGTTFYNFDGTQPRVSRYDVGAIEVPLRQFSSHVFRTKKSKFVKLDLVHSRNSIIANNTVCVHGIRLGRLCGPVIQGQGINRLSDSGVTHLDMIPFQVFLRMSPLAWWGFGRGSTVR